MPGKMPILEQVNVFSNQRDACGFWFNTPDGTIWTPGDSKLTLTEQLNVPTPDVILLFYSEDIYGIPV